MNDSSPLALSFVPFASLVSPRHLLFDQMTQQLSPSIRLLVEKASSQPELHLSPSDSRLCWSLPFASQRSVHDQYVRFDGGVRFGKILEDLDACAAHITYAHVLVGSTKRRCQQILRQADEKTEEKSDKEVDEKGERYLSPQEMMLVTASVDRIELQRRFPMNRDVIMRGNVVFVGRSSAEVHIEICSLEPLTLSSNVDGMSPPTEEKLLDAVFAMVACDPMTGGPAVIPPLEPQSMDVRDYRRWEQGKKNKERRAAASLRDFARAPPSTEEIALLHTLLYSGSTAPGRERHQIEHHLPGATIRPRMVKMDSTSLRSASMTQPQQRNINGKIFGGSLMRSAYELARTCAYIFAGGKSHPYLVASDSITFLRPVEIASVIEFHALVVYAAGSPSPLFQIQVETRIRDLTNNQDYISNNFSFTFKCDSAPLRAIQPFSYQEAILYLEGRRLIVRHEDKYGHQM